MEIFHELYNEKDAQKKKKKKQLCWSNVLTQTGNLFWLEGVSGTLRGGKEYKTVD